VRSFSEPRRAARRDLIEPVSPFHIVPRTTIDLVGRDLASAKRAQRGALRSRKAERVSTPLSLSFDGAFTSPALSQGKSSLLA
jgi:hypothetical protein